MDQYILDLDSPPPANFILPTSDSDSDEDQPWENQGSDDEETDGEGSTDSFHSEDEQPDENGFLNNSSHSSVQTRQDIIAASQARAAGTSAIHQSTPSTSSDDDQPRMPKRRRTSSQELNESPSRIPAKPEENPTAVEDTDDCCTICYEEYTSNGEHRLSSLKCGHFFGRNCIERWIRSEAKTASCPNCKKRAFIKDIRIHFTAAIKVLDNREMETLKEKCTVLETKNNTLELELVRAKRQIEEHLRDAGNHVARDASNCSKQSQHGSLSIMPYLKHDLGPNSSNADARAFDIVGSDFLIGTKKGAIFGSYAIRTFTLHTDPPRPHFVAGTAIPLHNSKCRVITAGHFTDMLPLVLSGGEDKTIVVSKIGTNSRQVWKMPNEAVVWTACWTSNKHFLAGLSNGRIYEFDYKNTEDRQPIKDLTKGLGRLPIIFLCYDHENQVVISASALKIVAYRSGKAFNLLIPAEHDLEKIRSLAWDPATHSLAVTFSSNHNTQKPIIHKLYRIGVADSLVYCNEMDTWVTNSMQNTTLWNNALFSLGDNLYSIVYDEDHSCIIAHDWSNQREHGTLSFKNTGTVKFATPTEIKAFNGPIGNKMIAILTEYTIYTASFSVND